MGWEGELLMLCCARPVQYILSHMLQKKEEQQQLPTGTAPRARWVVVGGKDARGEGGGVPGGMGKVML